jgi:serine/threonine-protein kinase HipA
MANNENLCYVYTQLPGTFEWVPCASLKVREAGAGAFQGTFTYGKRYLARKNVGALDPYHLQLTEKSLPDCFFRNEPTSLP